MGCTDGIIANIDSSCANKKIGGVEPLAWVFNRKELTYTRDSTNPSKVTAFDVIATKKGYTLKGFRKSLNCTSVMTASDTAHNQWMKTFSFDQNEVTAAANENIMQLEDIVIVYERKQKSTGGEGTFVIVGLDHGLYLKKADSDENAENGVTKCELKSIEGWGEYNKEDVLKLTDYATTLAALNALLITQS